MQNHGKLYDACSNTNTSFYLVSNIKSIAFIVLVWFYWYNGHTSAEAILSRFSHSWFLDPRIILQLWIATSILYVKGFLAFLKTSCYWAFSIVIFPLAITEFLFSKEFRIIIIYNSCIAITSVHTNHLVLV